MKNTFFIANNLIRKSIHNLNKTSYKNSGKNCL